MKLSFNDQAVKKEYYSLLRKVKITFLLSAFCAAFVMLLMYLIIGAASAITGVFVLVLPPMIARRWSVRLDEIRHSDGVHIVDDRDED